MPSILSWNSILVQKNNLIFIDNKISQVEMKNINWKSTVNDTQCDDKSILLYFSSQSTKFDNIDMFSIEE